MGFSVQCSWLLALSCLLCLGGEVWCDCTEVNMQIDGGNYKLTNGLLSGSLLIYNCSEGYYPYPAVNRLCQAGGSWQPKPKTFLRQRCRLVECPDPNVLEYGSVIPPQERYFVNNETTYECYSGYKLRGSSTRLCLPNGKWSGPTPICSRDTGNGCPDPGIPAGASRTGNVFLTDDRVTYNCYGNNMFLVGTSERVCLETGQWTGQEPECYFKYTYDSALEVSKSFGSAVKDSLTTLEPAGNSPTGRKIRLSKSGTLNIYIGVDISSSIEKEQVKDAKDVVKQLITKIASFSVTPNYEIAFFSSELHEIVSILDFMDGKKTDNDVYNDLDAFEVAETNNAGTNLNLIFETFLMKMAFIKERAGEEGFKEHRHAIIVFTDGAYNMGGSPEPTVERIKNMVYMNRTHEGHTHPRVDFLDIYIFGIGSEIYDADLQPLTVGTGPKHFFRVDDIKKLREPFEDIINEDDVKGLCGLYKNVDPKQKRTKRLRYPWLVFIVIQREGKTKKCLGSLVNAQFVLTAAHCFTFGDLAEHVVVQLEEKEVPVKTFNLHPKYNINGRKDQGVKEFYDYDVALIQLQKDVEFSIALRPICIPCTEETNAALKIPSDSTCLQHEELLLKTHYEKLNFLTKSREYLVDEKDVIAKRGEFREGCIRHALQAEGITTTDPSIPATPNFLCTGGVEPNRDHIACTGDSGGAVYKTYEQRTIQIALVSWGTKNLCQDSGLVESNADSRDFHFNIFRALPFLKSILGNQTQFDFAPLKFLDNVG